VLVKIAVTTYPVALQLAVNAEIDVAVPLFIKLTEQTVEETRTKMDEKLIKNQRNYEIIRKKNASL